MSDDHKAALAVGRSEGSAVRSYLRALESNKPKRGRKRTPDSIAKRLEAIDAQVESADIAKRLELIQEKMNLEKELAQKGAEIDISGLEADFIKVAKGYAQRKGISYAAFRAVGVPADVLAKANISRTD